MPKGKETQNVARHNMLRVRGFEALCDEVIRSFLFQYVGYLRSGAQCDVLRSISLLESITILIHDGSDLDKVCIQHGKFSGQMSDPCRWSSFFHDL